MTKAEKVATRGLLRSSSVHASALAKSAKPAEG